MFASEAMACVPTCPTALCSIFVVLESGSFQKLEKCLKFQYDSSALLSPILKLPNSVLLVLSDPLRPEYTKFFFIALPSSFHTLHSSLVHKKSRIRETKNLSTDADSRTDTILERLRDLS